MNKVVDKLVKSKPFPEPKSKQIQKIYIPLEQRQ